MKIGTQVRRARERALLTQEELATQARIGLTTLNRIERNHADPQFRTIRKIAQALDVSPRDLIGDDDE